MPATAQVRIAADTAQFKRAMTEVNKTMAKLGKNVGVLRKSFNLLSASINSLGKIGSGIGLPAILGASSKTFADFEKNISEVFTLLPKANRGAFNQMSKDALRFSEKFGVLPEEVTRGMYQSISAGVQPETLMEDDGFLETAQKSAIAGVTDLKTAVDAFTNVMNSYGEGVYNVAEVSDMMFKAVSMSKTTFRELSDYMYQILPTAGSLGIRLDDLLGSISALAATGTLTRVGTTQLRQMFIELGRTGDKANSAFLQASGGTPFQQFIRDGGRVTEVIAMIGDVAKRRGTDLRNLFGSVEAGNAAINLFNSQSVQGMIQELDEDSGAAAGAMSKAFTVMADTLSFKFARLQRTFMNLFIKIGDVIKPVLKDITSELTRVITNLSNLDWDGMKRGFYRAYTALKNIIKEGKLGELLESALALGFRSFVAIGLRGIQMIKSGLGKLYVTKMFSQLGVNIASITSSVFDFLERQWTKFNAMLFVGIDDIVNVISNGLKNGILEGLSVIPVYFSNIINDIASKLMGLPIIGDKVARVLYQSQFKSSDEAANAAQKEEGFRENLNRDTVLTEGVDDFMGVDRGLKFDNLRKELADYTSQIFESLDKYNEYATKQGKGGVYGKEILDEEGNRIQKIELDQETKNLISKLRNTEIPIDFTELSKLQNIVSRLDKQYMVTNDNESKDPINFAKNFSLLDKSLNAKDFSDIASELKNEAISSGGKSQELSENGVKERAEKFIDSALNTAQESIEKLEEKFDDFFTLPDYSASNEAITGFINGLKEGKDELIKRISEATSEESRNKDEEGIKRDFDKLVEDFLSFGEVLEKSEAKYTDGGIAKTPPADTWDLLKKQVGVVADSMQKVGGGGNVSGSVGPMDRNTDAIKKLTEEVRKLVAKDISEIGGFAQDFKVSNIRDYVDKSKVVDDTPTNNLKYVDLSDIKLPTFDLPKIDDIRSLDFNIPSKEDLSFPEFTLPSQLGDLSQGKTDFENAIKTQNKLLEVATKFSENLDRQRDILESDLSRKEYEMNY